MMFNFGGAWLSCEIRLYKHDIFSIFIFAFTHLLSLLITYSFFSVFISVGDKPVLKSSMSDVTVTAPQPATLSCRFDLGDPKANVTWYKASKEIYAGSKYDMSLTKGTAELTVDNCSLSDAGKYRCEASNRMGRATTEAELIIQAAPKIELDAKFRSKVEVKGGHSILLTANFTGYPNPKATWNHNGSPVNQSADVVIDSNGDELTIGCPFDPAFGHKLLKFSRRASCEVYKRPICQDGVYTDDMIGRHPV